MIYRNTKNYKIKSDEQSYTNTLDNINKMDKWLERRNLSKLIPEEIK